MIGIHIICMKDYKVNIINVLLDRLYLQFQKLILVTVFLKSLIILTLNQKTV